MLLQISTDDESRWAAVQNRDTSADGCFVYAVASTRIYCRPSCPSRRPHRRHVRFFGSTVEAEAQGYRACRRCLPKDPETRAGRRIRAAQSYLEQHLDETVTLERLGREVRMSPYHLQRTFKRLTGTTPKAYATARRLEQMKSRLKEGKSVTRATYDAGYSSPSRAYDHSRARLGMTPATYRRGGEGVRIAFTVVPTDAGQLLVAGTDRGICAVTLGDDAHALEAALRGEYPAAEIERGNGELEAWTRAVVDHLEEGGSTERLPLDLRGTAFQRQVWETLQRIPRGATRSYSEIARELGRPAAARAVAQACASNRLALVIPCHRVVREDGGLGGYRWGIERKRALLERERSAS
jgi:AraC family transcriptional regulator of adaptative response/methylated-DNA-[protein]-cysteine methyltransferase